MLFRTVLYRAPCNRCLWHCPRAQVQQEQMSMAHSIYVHTGILAYRGRLTAKWMVFEVVLCWWVTVCIW